MAKREMRTTAEKTPISVNEQTEVVQETPVEETKIVKYGVNNCKKLRIRKKPSLEADVVCVVDESNTLTIREIEGNKDWVGVTTDSGKRGFCMKKYVAIK